VAETYVTRDELAGELRGVRADIADLRRELHEEIAQLRRELHEELAQVRHQLHEAVALLTERIDKGERTMNRFMYVFGTTQVLMLVLLVLILRRVGL